MDLSILDFGHAGEAVALMAEADKAGYRRYWLGEHHSDHQCPNPLLLGALLAATSEGIRVGSGGGSLDYRSPFQIAVDARLIEFMMAELFDFGFARGMRLSPEFREAILNGRPAETLRDHYEK